MEEQQENLLRQLETEGQQIAKYRKLMLDLARSGKKIDCSRMLHICRKLNKHISSFDEINNQLIELETASWFENVIVPYYRTKDIHRDCRAWIVYTDHIQCGSPFPFEKTSLVHAV